MRNLTPEEIKKFEDLTQEGQKLKLSLKREMVDLRVKFRLPQEFDLSTDGFVIVNKEKTSHKLTEVQVNQIIDLDVLVASSDLALEELMFEYRLECGVPSFARLNFKYQWANPDNSLIVPEEKEVPKQDS